MESVNTIQERPLLNKVLMVAYLKKTWWVMALGGLYLLYAKVFVGLLTYHTNEMVPFDRYRADALAEHMFLPVSPFDLGFAVVIPMIMAIRAFSHLYHDKGLSYLYSKPVKRQSVFWSYVVTFLATYLGMITLSLLVYYGLFEVVAGNASLLAGHFIALWAFYLLLGLLIYAIMVLVGMTVGNEWLQTLIAVYSVLSIPMLISLVDSLLRSLLKGYTAPTYHFPKWLVYIVAPWYEVFDILTYYREVGIRSDNTLYVALGVVYVLALAVLMMGLAASLYEKRAFEVEEQRVSHRGMQHWLLITIVPIVALSLSVMFNETMGRLGLYAGLVVGCLLAIYLVYVLCDRQFSMKRRQVYGLSMLIVLGLFVGGLDMDVLGYEDKVPDAAHVTSIQISVYNWDDIGQIENPGPFEDYFTAYEYGLIVESKDNIDRLMEVHKQLIDLDVNEAMRNRVDLTYYLNNQPPLNRSYRYQDGLDLLIELVYTEEVLEKALKDRLEQITFYHTNPDKSEPIRMSYMEDSLLELTDEDYQDFLQAYRADYAAMTYEKKQEATLIGGIYTGSRQVILPIYDCYEASIQWCQAYIK